MLFNAQEAEAVLQVRPVKSAKHYEVYQKTGDSWTYLNASSSHIIYLSNLRRPKDAEGTLQELKVVAVGLSGERSKPLRTIFDWEMQTTDTTLPLEEPANIMAEAEVISYTDSTQTESPKNILTGTINNTSDKWYSSEQSDSVTVRFNSPRNVLRWVVEHAGAGGESSDNGLMNTKDFNLEYKDLNTGQWTIAVKKRNVNEHVTDVTLEKAVPAQEWRLHILTADNGSPWGGIRIYNWKMYESVNNESKNIPMATARAVHIKENLFSVVFSNGIEESTVYLYSDKEAKKILATGQVDSNGLVIFHRVKMKQASGILYYRSSQPDMALSPILAMPYQISDNAVEKVCLESDHTIEVNQLNPLNLSEHYLKIDYTDGTVNRISLDNVLVEVDAYDENQRGEQTLGVKFAGIESELPLSIDNQPINFESKEIQSITLGEAPQTSYFKGETLDLSDVLVTIVYTDGTRFNAPLTDTRMFQVSPFNEHEAGVQLLTITHCGFSTSLEVTVKEETVNFQRLDQLIGKVEAAMQQESTADKKDKEKVTQFLKAATALKLKDGATQSEVDQLVADNSSLG